MAQIWKWMRAIGPIRKAQFTRLLGIRSGLADAALMRFDQEGFLIGESDDGHIVAFSKDDL